MIFPSYNILILGLEKHVVHQFEQYSPFKEYCFFYCKDHIEAIELIDSVDVDLVICNSEIDGDNEFKFFNSLEPFLKKIKVPVFLVIDHDNFELVKVSLEFGVDNIIFKPFNFLSISRKIQNQLHKTQNLTVYNNESFLSFFEENSNPMAIVQAGKIKYLNKAFTHLFGGEVDSFLNVKLKHLFQFENDPMKNYEFKRLEAGLIPHCTLENVKLSKIDDSIFELFLVRDSAGFIVAQVNFAKSEFNLKNGNASLKLNSQSKSQISKKEIDYFFTQREKEIYHLSANGLPIKIIAQQLNLSPRTVEKHRSNIMEKLGAKNMIEVIKMI